MRLALASSLGAILMLGALTGLSEEVRAAPPCYEVSCFVLYCSSNLGDCASPLECFDGTPDPMCEAMYHYCDDDGVYTQSNLNCQFIPWCGNEFGTIHVCKWALYCADHPIAPYENGAFGACIDP